MRSDPFYQSETDFFFFIFTVMRYDNLFDNELLLTFLWITVFIEVYLTMSDQCRSFVKFSLYPYIYIYIYIISLYYKSQCPDLLCNISLGLTDSQIKFILRDSIWFYSTSKVWNRQRIFID